MIKNGIWTHDVNRLPVARCMICNHRIYRDENYTRKAFIDASGNNDNEYQHEKCPRHKLKQMKVTIESQCQDCGVIIQEEKNV